MHNAPTVKTPVVHKLRDRFCNVKLNFVYSYLLGVYGVEIDTLIQFCGEN